VGGRSLAIILIGSILDVHHRQREQEFLVGRVEKKPLVSGVEKNRSTLRSGHVNMKREDSIVSPTLSPTRAWISGRDPLLVVSIVTTRKIPQY
jgi:hypothetical protein